MIFLLLHLPSREQEGALTHAFEERRKLQIQPRLSLHRPMLKSQACFVNLSAPLVSI